MPIMIKLLHEIEETYSATDEIRHRIWTNKHQILNRPYLGRRYADEWITSSLGWRNYVLIEVGSSCVSTPSNREFKIL